MYEVIRAFYEIIMPILVILFYLKVLDSHKIILSLQKEVVEFLAKFRKEMHEFVKQEIALHVKEYHS